MRVTEALNTDERVVGAWLAGSAGRDESDAWADYDLHVAVQDAWLPSFLAGRRSLYASLGEVALVQDEIPGQPGVGDRFHLVYFSTPYGPVEVDWSYLPASEARKPPAHLLLLEKQSIPVMSPKPLSVHERNAEARRWSLFFWAMAPIAARLCGRGDLERSILQVRLLRRALICLWRLLDGETVVPPWQPEANRPLEATYDARLPRFESALDLTDVLDAIEALCAAAEGLQERLAPLAASVDPAIIQQAAQMVITARESVERGKFARRSYR